MKRHGKQYLHDLPDRRDGSNGRDGREEPTCLLNVGDARIGGGSEGGGGVEVGVVATPIATGDVLFKRIGGVV